MKKKATDPALKKKQILKDLEESVKWVKSHQESRKVDDNPNGYSPEFVAKIEKSMQQADEGKVVKIDLSHF
jgi:hypothetical protein